MRDTVHSGVRRDPHLNILESHFASRSFGRRGGLFLGSTEAAEECF